MLIENHDRIGLLRISNIGEDNISLRQSISSELNNIELTPSGLSPSSILIIRNLKDPMPGYFLPGLGNTEWPQRLHNSIYDIYHRAVRPVSGFIPLNSPYVLFADEAELLACLLLDMSRGLAGEHWWWKIILKDFPILKMKGLKGITQISPANFPAVLFQIYEWGQISSFFSGLDSEDCEHIFREVGREYGIPDPEIQRYILELKKAGNDEKFQYDTIWRHDADTSGEESKIGIFSRLTEYLSEPIRVNDISRIHEKEKISLLALCIIIRYRPSIARTNILVPVLLEFVFEILKNNDKINNKINVIKHTSPRESPRESDWKEKSVIGKVQKNDVRNKTTWPEKEIPDASSGYLCDHEIKSSEVEKNEKRIIISNFHFQSKDRLDNINVISKRSDNAAGILRAKENDLETTKKNDIETTENPVVVKLPEENFSSAGDEKILSEMIRSSEESETIPQVQEEATSNDNGIRSNLCGVFYLINLMRQLDLPACFEDDFKLSSYLGAWGMLELLSRAILGKGETFKNDPLWDVLTELDGREKGILPGEPVSSSGYYRLPCQWFEKCKSKKMDRFSWGVSESKLRIWSDNFLMLECERKKIPPVENAWKEAEYFAIDMTDISEKGFDEAPIEKIEGELLDLSSAHIPLMACIMPFIRWHLRSMLDQDAKKTNPEKDILILEGKVFVTSTHIDVVMKLEDASIPVRMSGLDIDPGWVPDLGRVVKFHFV